jgi:hypothetical protein
MEERYKTKDIVQKHMEEKHGQFQNLNLYYMGSKRIKPLSV